MIEDRLRTQPSFMASEPMRLPESRVPVFPHCTFWSYSVQGQGQARLDGWMGPMSRRLRSYHITSHRIASHRIALVVVSLAV